MARMGKGTRFVWIGALAAAACAPGPPEPPPAAALLQAARAATGWPGLDGEVGVRIHASGTLDKAAELQGHTPGEASPGPLTETLGLGAGGFVGHAYREVRFDGTFEGVRELYPTPGTRRIVVDEIRLVIPGRGAALEEARAGIARRYPGALLAELADGGDVRAAEPPSGGEPDRTDAEATPVAADPAAPATDDAALWWLAGRLGDGTDVLVGIHPGDTLVREVRYTAALPVRGPTRVRWWYDDWRPTPSGVRVPWRYGSEVGGRPYTEVRVDSVADRPAALAEHPDDFRVIPEQEIAAGPEPPPALRLDTLAAGVLRLRGVRSGFAPLVVVQDSGLVVVDAPASFPLLASIPAGETDPALTGAGAVERMAGYLEARFPDHPGRTVVLTHGHGDHVGGVGAWEERGAHIVSTAPVREAVRSSVAAPDGARAGRSSNWTIVDSTAVLGTGPRRVEVVPIGANPHAAGMVVVRVPERRLLYVSDLVTPGPLDSYPGASHAALDRFFAGWAEERGWSDHQVAAMHGSGVLGPEHLRRARERGGGA